MSLLQQLDACKKTEEDNIGMAIRNSLRRIRTRKLIKLIESKGEQNGTQSRIEIKNENPLNS